MAKATLTALGVRITPHLFRTIAATFIAEQAPTQAGIIPDVLGHSDPGTAHRYYNLAAGVNASRRYRDTLGRVRTEGAESGP